MSLSPSKASKVAIKAKAKLGISTAAPASNPTLELAPAAGGEGDWVSVPHLPDWVSIGASETLPTAYPNSVVHREKEKALKKMLDVKVFEDFVNDPLGRYR